MGSRIEAWRLAGGQSCPETVLHVSQDYVNPALLAAAKNVLTAAAFTSNGL